MATNHRADPASDVRPIAELFRVVRRDEEARLAVGRALLRVIREDPKVRPNAEDSYPSPDP